MSLARKNLDKDAVRAGNAGNAKDSPCYFCNELFEMGHLQNHLKQCGSILEQCPLRCGAWIQRKHKETHVKDCPQMEKTRTATSPTHARQPEPVPPPTSGHTWAPRAVPLDDCVSYLEKEVANIKLVLTEESSRRDIQSTELETLRSKLVLVEEQNQHFLSNLVSLRGTVDDEAERAANWAAQFKHDLANVQLALQELQSQQLSTVMRLESAVSSLVHEQQERELLEQALTQHDHRIRAVNKLEEVIEYIKRSVEEERERNAEQRAALEAELAEARRSSEQLMQLSALRLQLQDAAADRPPLDRLSVLEVATATARAEAAEHAARADVLARDLRALTKSYLKMRNELADFQARVNFDSHETGSDDGRFIWRIDNFTARMKDAKENDTILTSPLFRTSKYGYTLKAELHLNGIGKWRGRHVTCTVRAVGGPYDALLPWPCDISVNIALKDQPANRNQAMDIVKSLQLRRKSSSKRHDYDSTDQEPERTRSTDTLETARSTENLDKNILQLKRQYIFIPHTSLDKFEYIKNDVMFLEFVTGK
ncbi:unnamed protein product [Diatraea saccharalis]|uniref:MATH domain-containing protein n=1 Tax=Diatraea saccharalis TaxID=40085 RepID=A0A9N9N1M4_9NEOP|nr:unnamed protein product [Diatraea saccharalis]